jgi:hypothetical protein
LGLKEMLKRGGFQLTKFASNNKYWRNSPSELRASAMKEIDPGNSLPSTKTLGMKWKTEEDVFGFSIGDKLQIQAPTKRKMLASIATIFDPLGLVAPILLEAKRIIQSLTRCKITWDEQLQEAILRQWEDWCSRLASVES